MERFFYAANVTDSDNILVSVSVANKIY